METKLKKWMTGRFVFVLLHLLLIAYCCVAQERVITGVVRSVSENLPGAVITVTDTTGNDVLGYTVTDDKGRFVLKIGNNMKQFIYARIIGYTTQKHVITPHKTDYIFTMTEAPILLKEVKVKATPVRSAGDTTRYLTSSFTHKNDYTLADVLKRMPGFHISDEGRIRYGGRDISNFYIDGSNMMTNNYSIAVNSIKPEDVGSVEVIEHHQPIKMFEDLLFSNNTAINIVLKEKAKNRWVGLTEIGGGTPSRWKFDVNVMRFARKIKTLNTYKGNNTGYDMTGGNTSGGGNAREVIALPNTNNPFLERSKTTFNRSHRLSLNNQWNMSQSFTITPKIDFFESTIDCNTNETRRYFSENRNIRNVFSRDNSQTHLFGTSPSLRIESNNRHMYISNITSSDFRRSAGQIDAMGTYPNKTNGRIDAAYLQNDLYLMYRFGKKVIGIKSLNEWSRLPQNLDILQKNTNISERVITSTFRSQTSTSQMIAFGRSTLSLEEGCSIERSSLLSLLDGVTPNETLQNKFNYRTVSLYVSPTLSISKNAWRFRFSIPLNYQYSNYTDYHIGRSYVDNRLMPSPSLSLIWNLGRYFTISTNNTWQDQPENATSFFSSPLLSSYPYLQTGITEYNRVRMTNVSTMIRYKNVKDGLFCNVVCGRIWQNCLLMPVQDFDDIYIRSSLTRNPYVILSNQIAGSASYMINAIQGGVTIDGLFSSTCSPLMQNGQIQYNAFQVRQLSMHIYASPRNLLDLDYTCQFSDQIYQIENVERNVTHTLHQKLSASFAPIKPLNITATGNHYFHSQNGGDHRHIYLLDATTNWRLSSIWTVRLTAQNILNQRTFIYTSYAESMLMERQYRLQPFTLLFSVVASF